MHVYLSWVPIGYIFSSNMVEQLLKLFPQAPYRNVALQCLTEVGENANLQLHAAKPFRASSVFPLGLHVPCSALLAHTHPVRLQCHPCAL